MLSTLGWTCSESLPTQYSPLPPPNPIRTKYMEEGNPINLMNHKNRMHAHQFLWNETMLKLASHVGNSEYGHCINWIALFDCKGGIGRPKTVLLLILSKSVCQLAFLWSEIVWRCGILQFPYGVENSQPYHMLWGHVTLDSTCNGFSCFWWCKSGPPWL